MPATVDQEIFHPDGRLRRPGYKGSREDWQLFAHDQPAYPEDIDVCLALADCERIRHADQQQ